MIARSFLAIVSAAALGGCAHGGLMPGFDQRSSAVRSFEYALLANNAYADASEWTDLLDDTKLVFECDNDEIGLAYSIFKRQKKHGRPEYLFAFRGTEELGPEGKEDWGYGNVS